MTNDKLQARMDKFYKNYQTEEVVDKSASSTLKEKSTKDNSFMSKIFSTEYLSIELEKYKKQGVLTEEEYEKRKKEIDGISKSRQNRLENKGNSKKIYQGMVDLNLERYSESIAAYKNIIDSTAKLCHELNLKDSMSIFVVFDYLLWNGYFSRDKDYIYTIAGRTNPVGYYGTDIINGQGVCLNKSHMLGEILKSMDYESYIILNKVYKKMKRDYKPDIERKVKSHGQIPMKIASFLLSPITNIFGNHACTLVRKDDVYYIYDPTNLCVYKLDNFLHANIIGGVGGIDIKPYSLSWMENLSNKKIVEIVDSFKNVENEMNPYDIAGIKSSFETNLELCRNNTGLFNDFHAENESNRSKVLEIFKK